MKLDTSKGNIQESIKILRDCPVKSREISLAITKLEEAEFWLSKAEEADKIKEAVINEGDQVILCIEQQLKDPKIYTLKNFLPNNQAYCELIGDLGESENRTKIVYENEIMKYTKSHELKSDKGTD